MDRLRKLFIVLTGLALIGTIAAGCDSGTQEPAAPEESTASTAAANDPNARPPDAIPEDRIPKELPEGVTAAIPENFPEEVPIYPGSVPARGKGVDIDGVPVSAVHLMSLDDPETVFQYYSDSLERDGWTIDTSESLSRNNGIGASRGGCRVRVLAAPSEDGGTNIILVTECKETS